MALPTFTMRELLEAGVHFGHHVRRWNPKMEPYLHGERSKVHIIDLSQTVPLLYRALGALRDVAAQGQRILFVGSKRQSSRIIAETALSCGQYYINHRWLGGMLTNWQTVSRSINRLLELEKEIENDANDTTGDTISGMTKKERLSQQRRYQKLERSLGGIKNMGGVPSMLFIIDTNKEATAVLEAAKLGIPVVAVLDSNSDPEGITWPIPGNDDARRAIEFYCQLVSESILDGLRQEAMNMEKEAAPTDGNDNPNAPPNGGRKGLPPKGTKDSRKGDRGSRFPSRTAESKKGSGASQGRAAHSSSGAGAAPSSANKPSTKSHTAESRKGSGASQGHAAHSSSGAGAAPSSTNKPSKNKATTGDHAPSVQATSKLSDKGGAKVEAKDSGRVEKTHRENNPS